MCLWVFDYGWKCVGVCANRGWSNIMLIEWKDQNINNIEIQENL